MTREPPTPPGVARDSIQTTVQEGDTTSGPQPDATSETRSPAPRVHLVEVLVFLGLIVPSLIISLFATSQGTIGFGLLAASTMGRDLGLVALIVFFLWRNGERLREVGLRKHPIWTEIGLGIVMFAPFFYALRWIQRFFIDIGLSVPPSSSSIAIPSPVLGEVLLGTMLVVVVAFSEELIFRGYLIHRFQGAGASTVLAVVMSTAVFGLGHGYEGTAGLATVTIMGLIFALVYLWRGSLTIAMTLHFLQDFVVIVLLPLLRS